MRSSALPGLARAVGDASLGAPGSGCVESTREPARQRRMARWQHCPRVTASIGTRVVGGQCRRSAELLGLLEHGPKPHLAARAVLRLDGRDELLYR